MPKIIYVELSVQILCRPNSTYVEGGPSAEVLALY